MASPNCAIVIPESWMMLQLVPMARERGSALIPASEQEKHAKGQCLLQLVFDFCRLFERLYWATRDGFQFSWAGGRAPWSLVQRRSIDFLVIIVLNFMNTPTPIRGLGTVWRRIQEVCIRVTQRMWYRELTFFDITRFRPYLRCLSVWSC
jgi:hypothetical protein